MTGKKHLKGKSGQKAGKADGRILGVNYLEDMSDLGGSFTDKNWNHKKVKDLLKGLIDSEIIQKTPLDQQIFLETIMEARNIHKVQGKWKKFFDDVQQTTLTGGKGLQKIIDWANSNKKSPPSLLTDSQETDEEEDYTETELSDATTSSIISSAEETKHSTKLSDVDTILAYGNMNKQLESVSKDHMEFLVTFCVHQLWKTAFKYGDKVYDKVKNWAGVKNNFLKQYVGTFLKEYQGVTNLTTPKQYRFPEEPFLMQRYVAYKTKQLPRFANFSEPGSGKTQSAILASTIINSKMTLVLCPISIVKQWEKIIKDSHSGSETVHGDKVFSAKYDKSKHQYLILHYDMLNQRESFDKIKKFKTKIDFVILDEIQNAKGAVGGEGKISRRTNLMELLTIIKRKNSKSKFLALSATPIVNHLREGKALLEMLNLLHTQKTKKMLQTIQTNSTPIAAIRMHHKLTGLSIRDNRGMSQRNICYEPIEVEVLNPRISAKMINDPLTIELILTPARIPAIIDNIEGQTIIYTEYVGNAQQLILKQLESELKNKKIKCGFYTGSNKAGLDRFLKKEIKVLIASVPISVGIDGLQKWCNRLIFNSLPWTHAQYEQIIGRIARQGQTKTVTVFHINGTLVFGVKRKVKLGAVSKNMELPNNFYSTTKYPTEIFLNNKWTDVGNMMGDQCIIVKARKVMCIPINRVKKGDKIVVGKNGIRVRLEYDDQWKHSRIKFKQTLADCAVDGIIPTKKGLATPKQVAREAVKWLESMQ